MNILITVSVEFLYLHLIEKLLKNEVNVKGTLNILESVRLNNVKKVVYSSSAAVYRDELILSKNESSVTKPISSYESENLCSVVKYMKLYSKLYEKRQGNTSYYNRVIFIFEKKSKDNELSNIYEESEQCKDLEYVKDVVKEKKAIITLNISEVFCIGISKKVSINDLLKILNEKYLKDIKANYLLFR